MVAYSWANRVFRTTKFKPKYAAFFNSSSTTSGYISALEGETHAAESGPIVGASQTEGDEDAHIITTEEEREAFYIVKAIVRKVVDAHRIHIRDTQSYCGVLLDDNNRKPICRFYFNGKTKYLGLLDGSKKTTRHKVDDLSNIYAFSDELCAAACRYAEGIEEAIDGDEPQSTVHE